MEISINAIVTVVVAVVGFLVGKLWNMNKELSEKVTYKQCSTNRRECPCVKDVNDIKDRLNQSQNNTNH